MPWGGEESLAVELLTVPFFAVDADGRPVLDLRADEVAIVVGGQRVTPDTFDAYLRDGSPAPASSGAAPTAPGERPQQVVFLLDRAFLDAQGWRSSQLAALELVDSLPAIDRVSLMVNDPEKGLQVLLASVPADRAGRRRFRDELSAILPAPRRLDPFAESYLPPYVMGKTNNGQPGEQVHNAYEAGGALARAEYRQVAYDLAENLRLLALILARTPGQKTLLAFTGGIDSRLYFEGEVGFGSVASGGSSEAAHVDLRRAEPMIERFHKAFAALAGAGVGTVLVNPEPDRSGREMVAQMREAVGAVLVENPNSAAIERTVEQLTAARYVAGAYANRLPPGAAAATVEIAVTRPGVRTYSPRRLPVRRSYQELSPLERKFLVVSVVREGAGPAARELNGNIASAPAARGRRLRFEAERPALGDRPVDFYQVLLRGEKGQSELDLVDYREQLRVAAGQALTGEAELESGDASYVWALLAVEPESGELYLRRLQLLAPPVSAGR